MNENGGNTSFGMYKISTPEEMEILIEEYFHECDSRTQRQLVGSGRNAAFVDVPDPKPYTWTGLALSVGLTSRSALDNYFNYPGYGPILERAHMKIKEQWEGKLQRLGNNNGVIFNLTNMTRKDAVPYVTKQEVNIGGQSDNPLKVETSVDDLSLEQLRQIREIMDGSDKE